MAVDAKGQEEARLRREVGPWTTPERVELLRRIRQHTVGQLSTDDLLQWATIELNDALDNVAPIEGGSEFHAGCCMMRAEAAIHTVQKRLRAETQDSADISRHPSVDKVRCPACKRLTRITTAGCDHCDLEDK
jgi:hypothetical protein